MKLFEFEAKNILQKYGIAVPRGGVARSAEEAETVAREIGKPVALKSQILVAGRGKAGGIKFVSSAAEAKKVASSLIGSAIKESTVRSLLVEEKLDIAQQFYTSVAIDRQARAYVILASTEGGVDIEETARTSPDKISTYRVDPIAGFNEPEATAMLGRFRLKKEDTAKLASVITTLYKATLENDAELVELNPLAKTASGEFVAADARIILDDNALFRHTEFQSESLEREDYTPLETEARKQGLQYVDLSGDIGVVGNGAGLVMATLDLVDHFGGRPANFLDIGGGGNVEVTRKGLLLVMSKPDVKAVVLNILAGITRCDVVAQAVIEALEQAPVKKPIVVRMMGTNEELGKQMLDQAGINSYPNMEEAIQQVLKTVGSS